MAEIAKINLPVKEVRAYCASEPIERLSDFGSVMPDMLRQDTEIGLVVEYSPGASITYIDMARQERELEAMIGSVVDLRTPNELERRYRQQILESAILVFAKNSS